MTTSTEQTQPLSEVANAEPAEPVTEVTTQQTEEAPKTEAKPQETESEPPKTEKGKMPTWVKERLQKNAEQKRQKDQIIEAKNAYIKTLEAEISKLKPPKADSFQTSEEYSGALLQHTANQAALNTERIRAQGELQQAQQEAQVTEADIWELQREEARAQYPDYDLVLNNSTVQISASLQRALDMAPNKAQMVYTLAKNPQEAYRLNAMPPGQILQEFGMIQARFAQSPAALAPKAPPKPPIKPIGGGVPETSKSEYKEWEAEANRKRGLF